MNYLNHSSHPRLGTRHVQFLLKHILSPPLETNDFSILNLSQNSNSIHRDS